jgi:hypothetical protein
MNLYLLRRTDKCSYDSHDAFVVAADNETEAVNMQLGYSTSWTTPNNIKVTYLGIAANNIKKGEILNSYNAG